MVFFTIDDPDYNEDALIAYLRTKKIKISPAESGEYRFATHFWIDKKSIDFAINSINSYFNSR